MAEYIEREATIELLRSLGSRDYRREKGTIQEAIKMVSFSEYTPTADVATVVHGRWICDPDPGKVRLVCSVCGQGMPFVPEYLPGLPPYCNCGARMDKEADYE